MSTVASKKGEMRGSIDSGSYSGTGCCLPELAVFPPAFGVIFPILITPGPCDGAPRFELLAFFVS